MTAPAAPRTRLVTEPLSLLLVEDDAADAALVEALLEDALPQATLSVARDLASAVRALDDRAYDVVLADLSLPDADGLAVVGAVHGACPDTALVVLTGRADGDLALEALARGAQDYLVKGSADGARLATAALHALQRRRAEEQALRNLRLAHGLLDALEAPTCAVDHRGRIVAVNEAWRAATAAGGGDPDRCGLGSDYLAVCDAVRGEDGDAHSAHEVAAGLRGVLSGRSARFEHEYPCDSPDAQRWFSVRVSPVEVEGARGAVISHVDVSGLRRVQDELSHLALHDVLTGLPNRLLLSDRLQQALVDSSRDGRHAAVAFVDLDRFKRVNDSLGHAAGDALLVQVAARLRAVLRAGDTLSRFAGDEFVVVLRHLPSASEAVLLGDRLVAALDAPFELDGASVSITASVGVVVAREGQTAEQLLLEADAAMYDAKARGRGRVRVFSSDLRRGAEERLAVEEGLRGALVRDELVLHYQPVVSLATGRPVAVEALVRWEHPERGLLLPGAFIEVAEASGLVVPLGRWALRRACADAAGFDGAAADLDVAVNLSVRQVTRAEVVEEVRAALADSGLAPSRLVLEITESAVVEDAEAVAASLEALHALGVRLAVDDFGTGYSSLLYLRRYPVSALKLDRAFVAGLTTNADDEAICGSVVRLARAVGATSIAEGVETPEQYAALRGLDCELGQGFLWSPAVALEQLPDAVARCAQVTRPRAARPRRPAVPTPRLAVDVAERMAHLHAAGASLHTIAAALNRDGTRSPTGARWHAHTVARQLADLAHPVREHRAVHSACSDYT